MPIVLKAWPPWSRFIESKGESRTGNAQYKQGIAAKYGAKPIQESWLRTCKSLEALTAQMAVKWTSIIPVLMLDKMLNASEEKKGELKEAGCFVVRDVVPRSEATVWFQGLKQYIADNKDEITGTYFQCSALFERLYNVKNGII
jgi:hypothetical protein